MEKQHKIAFFDVDGTIYRNDCRVPSSTVKAITQFVNDGNYAFLCTGRGASTIPKEVEALPFYGRICSCGTYVEIDGKAAVNAAITGNDCQIIMDTLRKYRCPFFIENPDYFYYDPEYMPNNFDKVIDSMHRNYPGKFQYVDNLPNRISKMTGYPEERALIPEIINALSEWFEIIVHEEYSYIEITLKDYTKGSGVKKVLDLLQIDKNDSYGFGDSGNDIPMLDEVGHAFVLGDAPEEMRKKYIATDSIYADGLANAMKKYDLI